MSRPTKCRQVCHFPEAFEFYPLGEEGKEPVILTIDEFEAIRLIDHEGLSQQKCGAQLGVGRTTAQNIYDKARKKLAHALVLGLPIKIEGGDYRLCNGSADFCYKQDCFKKQIQANLLMNKGENIMRIAVAYENENIFQHFGRTEQFKIYDIEDGKIIKSEIIDTNGSGHGALAGVLASVNADALICGGIGGGAQTALKEANLQIYGGVSGNADEAVNAFIVGNLGFDPDVHCDHHDHEHGDEPHTCHENGCGKEGCGSHHKI